MSAAKKSAPASTSSAKENAQNANAIAPLSTTHRVARIGIDDLPEVDDDLELQKARGQTESQKQMREYHENEFQSTDPTSGKPRDEFDSVKQDAPK